MNGFELAGLMIAAFHLVFAFLVAVSLQESARRGSAAAGTIYLILALATIVWITRQVLWQQ
jgi:drug/metabolite transporter superfamily protein YnfA